MKTATILGVCVLWAGLARAEEARFGGEAPAMLPAQSTAVYGYFGVPELGIGFRQGLGPVEIDSTASLDYFDLTLAGEVRARFLAIGDRALLQVAPFLGLGIAWDSGTTYSDKRNFGYTAVRVHGGAIGSRAIADTVSLIGLAELRWDLFTSPSGGHRIEPLFGGGVEVMLGEGVSALAVGELGVDARALPDGTSNTSLGYGLRFGFGFRLF